MRYLPIFRRLPLCCAELLLLSSCLIGSLVINAEAGTASQTLIFSATFVSPTCTMSIPTTIDFSPNGVGIQSSALTGEGVEAIGGVAISFSDCSSNSMVRPPQIIVTGRTVQLGGSDFYFADLPEPTGAYTANGYGVKLSLSGQMFFEDNTNIAMTGGSQGSGVINAKAGSTLSSLNGSTLNLTAKLSCGNYSPCSSAPDHQLGAFKATVRFQLAYD